MIKQIFSQIKTLSKQGTWSRSFANKHRKNWTPANRLPGDERWQEARARSSGYDSELILDRALASAVAVKQGKAAFERDTVLFLNPDYRWQLLACVATVAASKRGRIHILDIGGSLASVYFQHRAFLKTIPHLQWSIVEQPHFVSAGQKHLQDKTLRFFDSIDSAERFKSVDMTLFLSSLQYMPDPFETLNRVSKTRSSHLIIDRIPLSAIDDDEVVVQQVPNEIYAASYPQWLLSESKLKRFVTSEIGFNEIARYNDGIDGSDHVGMFFSR